MAGMGFGFSDETREATKREAAKLEEAQRAQELALEECRECQVSWSAGLQCKTNSMVVELGPRWWVLPLTFKHGEGSFACPVCPDRVTIADSAAHLRAHAQGRIELSGEVLAKTRALMMGKSLDQLLAAENNSSCNCGGQPACGHQPRLAPSAPGATIGLEDFLVKPTTKADEQTREKKWAELREEFVRTNDPVTFGAMLQQVNRGLTPAERTNQDIAAYLDAPATYYTGKDGKPAHPHSNKDGHRFLYQGAECTQTCPCWPPGKCQLARVGQWGLVHYKLVYVVFLALIGLAASLCIPGYW